MKIENFHKETTLYKNIFKEENNRRIDVYKYNNSILTGINLYYPNVLLYENNSEKLILTVI